MSQNRNNSGGRQHTNSGAKKKGLPAAVVIVIAIILVLTGKLGGGNSNTDTEPSAQTTSAEVAEDTTNKQDSAQYVFRNAGLLNQHYKKHGIDMGFDSAEAYEAAAAAVIEKPDALYKTEAEDGDGVYFLESTGEFVVLSTDGYIRTYYYADYGYFERQ